MNKKQLVAAVSTALHSYGYKVYIAKSCEYGFYTDGKVVVSFGGCWNFCLDFSGNYRALKHEDRQRVGTGWQIAKEVSIPSKRQADAFIAALPPSWATSSHRVQLTTPEQHLAVYGESSGYTEFQPQEVQS